MMRFILSATALIGLAACDPAIPDSGAGVGFDDYGQYQQQQAARDAALAGGSLPAPQAVSSEALAPTTGAQTAAAAPGAAGAPLAAGGALQASPSNPAPAIRTGGISEENDFGAVSAQRTIASDAALRAQNQQQYQVIQPTALPTRSGQSAPNIVQYAIQSRTPKGQKVFKRSGFNAQKKFTRNCAGFASSDQAQQAFLAAGGPQKDRQGLDPDGDGYACAWDPAPYRSAVNG